MKILKTNNLPYSVVNESSNKSPDTIIDDCFITELSGFNLGAEKGYIIVLFMTKSILIFSHLERLATTGTLKVKTAGVNTKKHSRQAFTFMVSNVNAAISCEQLRQVRSHSLYYTEH